MKMNAMWIVYLKPNWTYDVSVTIGSRVDSTYNLKVIDGSSTYSLARFQLFVTSKKFFSFFFFLKKKQINLIY